MDLEQLEETQQLQQAIETTEDQGGQPSFQPTDSQISEGLNELAGVVDKPDKPTRVSGGKDGVSIFSWILTMLVWCLIVPSIGFAISEPEIAQYIAIGAAAVAIVYWIECCCASTGKYLSNVVQNEGAVQLVERLKKEAAVINWHVECYHFEKRTRKIERDGPNVEWESYEEKVVTWTADEQYKYTNCIDLTGELLGLGEYNLTKLNLRKSYGFLNEESQQHYDQQRRNFRLENWKDVHQQFYEQFDIPGLVEHVLAEAEPGTKPGWMNCGCYWFFNLVFMSPCFRKKMSIACGHAEYTFIKQLSA